jgi:hypothetical protein
LTRTGQLNATGLYVNRKDSVYRDISLGQTGTTYSPILKKSIVSVDGQVSGLHSGLDTILVRNGIVTTKVTVTIDPGLLKVKKLKDTINLNINVAYGDPPTVLNGTNLSGEDIKYTLLNGPVSLANGIMTVKGIGQGKIVASSPGDAYFSAASNDTVSFNITLPAANFKIAITSTTCQGSSNGSVNIMASDTLNYTATITGNGVNTSYPFTKTQTISNLAAGTYHICITVKGQAGYQQCYDLVITEPKDLSLYTTVNPEQNTVTLNMDGSNVYNIELNGTLYSTSQNTITLPLAKGDNTLSVSTDKICQGIISSLINISNNIVPYPIPFQDVLKLNLGNKIINNVSVKIMDATYNKLVYTNHFTKQAGIIQLDVSKLNNGVYVLQLSMDNSEMIFKIIKK